MESHKASFFHEQIYLENFQFTKYSKLHGNRCLNKFITTLETYPVSAAILKEVPTKRFTKRYGEKYDKKIFLSNLDSIFLNCFGFLRTKTFKRRKNSPMNVHVN